MQESITEKSSLIRANVWHILSVLLAFIFTEAILFYHQGVRSSWDSTAYLQNAESVLNGQGIAQGYAGYASYIYYLASHYFLGGDKTCMALGQIILAGISVLTFYRIALHFLTTSSSLYASVSFAVWPALRHWDAYLYTDSLYVSLLTVSLYLALLVKERKILWLWLVPVLLFTSFIRPPALIFTASLVLAIATPVFFETPFKTKPITLYGLILLTILTCILFLFRTEHATQLLWSYEKGEVIYPNVCISPPQDLIKAPNLYQFLVLNPVWSVKLGIFKLWYFLSGTKPYYSSAHNVMAITSNVFLYAFSILSICYKSWKKEELVLIISFFACNIFMVALTAENWDGRFHLPFIPLLLLLSFKGAEKLFDHLANKYTRFR